MFAGGLFSTRVEALIGQLGRTNELSYDKMTSDPPYLTLLVTKWN
jgi:hypothetical protein